MQELRLLDRDYFRFMYKLVIRKREESFSPPSSMRRTEPAASPPPLPGCPPSPDQPSSRRGAGADEAAEKLMEFAAHFLLRVCPSHTPTHTPPTPKSKRTSMLNDSFLRQSCGPQSWYVSFTTLLHVCMHQQHVWKRGHISHACLTDLHLQRECMPFCAPYQSSVQSVQVYLKSSFMLREGEPEWMTLMEGFLASSPAANRWFLNLLTQDCLGRGRMDSKNLQEDFLDQYLYYGDGVSCYFACASPLKETLGRAPGRGNQEKWMSFSFTGDYQ